MSMSKASKLAMIGIVMGSCVGCDQMTKVIARQQLQGQDAISLLGGMLRLTYVENPGALLGLGSGLSAQARFWILGVAVTVGLFLLGAFAIGDRTVRGAQLLPIAMIIGGGTGNLIDRAIHGVVRDFLNLGIGDVRTGIFNVADMAVTFGVVMLLGGSLIGRLRGRRPSNSDV